MVGYGFMGRAHSNAFGRVSRFFDLGYEPVLRAVRGWRSLHVTDSDHPYMKRWWVPGLQIGYEHTFIHQAADFLDGLASGKPAAPTFRDALMTDRVTDAVLRSAASENWERV